MGVANYVGAAHRRDTEQVLVWERGDDGIRTVRSYDEPFYFFIRAEDIDLPVQQVIKIDKNWCTYLDGEKKPVESTLRQELLGATVEPEPLHSIFEEPLLRVTVFNKDMMAMCKGLAEVNKIKTFELNIQPVFKVLMENYEGRPAQKINIAFLDIETNVRDATGFVRSRVNTPLDLQDSINAVTVYQSWKSPFDIFGVPITDDARGHLVTLLVPPTTNQMKFVDGVLVDTGKKWTLANFKIAVEEERKLIEEQHKADGNDKPINIRGEFVFCLNERELLMRMLNLIADADVLSGWNSEFFDLPYIIRRVTHVLGPKAAERLCLDGAGPPRESTVERYGEQQTVFKLFGRTHLDYLDVFKKFAQDAKYESYSLGFVGHEEVGVPKVSFDESFQQFYETRFPRFALYNQLDVGILVKLEQKRKLMQLVNVVAHESTCLFENLTGTVRYIEMAMTNRAHNIHRQRIPDQVGIAKRVGGALVLDPFAGLHEWIGSVDINSLYPSVIRSLNISPEMFIGLFISGNCDKSIRSDGNHFAPVIISGKEIIADQSNAGLPDWSRPFLNKDSKDRGMAKNFDDFEEDQFDLSDEDDVGITSSELDWAGIIAKDNLDHTLRVEEWAQKMHRLPPEITMTGAEWYQWLADKNFAISAYGAVFDQSRHLGIIARSLQDWYAERKALQREKKAKQKQIVDITESAPLAKANQKLDDGFVLYYGHVLSVEQYELIQKLDFEVEDLELRQMARKLQLNSSYGALLSAYFSLGRPELGASVTAVGRAITKHMIQHIGTLLTGNEVKVFWYNAGSGKKAGNEAVYNVYRSISLDMVTRQKCDVTLLSDTDSCYFRTLTNSKDEAIQVADFIAAEVDRSFVPFMKASFLCSDAKYWDLIHAGREVIASRGLFLNAKKKYTLRVVDSEGIATFKLKMMGSELKKVDTPQVIRDFLQKMTQLILDGDPDLADEVKSGTITPELAATKIRPFDEEELCSFVVKNRRTLVVNSKNQLSLGVTKGVNAFDKWYERWASEGGNIVHGVSPTTLRALDPDKRAKGKKDTVPGHIIASINFNELAEHFDGKLAQKIKAGDKVKMFYLKPNMFKIKSIGIPGDAEHFPAWFAGNFAVDTVVMEAKLIDAKIKNIFETLDIQLPTQMTQKAKTAFIF